MQYFLTLRKSGTNMIITYLYITKTNPKICGETSAYWWKIEEIPYTVCKYPHFLSVWTKSVTFFYFIFFYKFFVKKKEEICWSSLEIINNCIYREEKNWNKYIYNFVLRINSHINIFFNFNQLVFFKLQFNWYNKFTLSFANSISKCLWSPWEEVASSSDWSVLSNHARSSFRACSNWPTFNIAICSFLYNITN